MWLLFLFQKVAVNGHVYSVMFYVYKTSDQTILMPKKRHATFTLWLKCVMSYLLKNEASKAIYSLKSRNILSANI